MADIRRLVDSGIVPGLASELGKQIDAKLGNVARLAELGMPTRLAAEFTSQLANGGDPRRLMELGLPAVTARQISLQISGGTPTPTPTPTPGGPTPDGAEEAVISPAVTFARSTYSQAKTGPVVARQAQMAGGNGVYWGDLAKMPSTAYPDRIFNYYTTDHDTGDGGIYLSVCVGNPKTAANWKNYGDAVAAGWLDDFTTKPAANPIFIGSQNVGSARQAETARVRKIGSQYVLTYQLGAPINSQAGGTYRNQATLRAFSSDGLNWARNTNVALLEVNAGQAIGNGHTGYLRWGLNPFPGIINPSTGQKYLYVGYSLIGGTNRSTQGQWATDDPVAGNWTFITPLHKASGRASPGGPYDNKFAFNWNTLNIDSIRQTRQGWAAQMSALQIGSGTAEQIGSTYEVLFGDDGITMLGKPQLLIEKGAAGSYDESTASLTANIIFGNERIVMYNAASGSDEKTNAMTTGPLRNPQNTWFDPLLPAIPATITTKTANFKGASAIPAGFEVVTVGTTPPAPTYDANGILIPLDGTQATPSEFYVFESTGIDPATTDYVDFYVKDWITPAGAPNRVPFFGFATTKGAKGAQTDAIWLSNGEGTGVNLCFNQLVGGTSPLPTVQEPYHWGIGGPGNARDQTRDGANKGIGLRWFPQRDRMFVLGEGGTEMEEFGTSTGNYAGNLDKTKRWYPVMGFRGQGAAAVSERVGSFTVKVGNTASPAPTPATIGNVTRTVSAADGNSYSFPTLDLGTAAGNRYVAFIVSGYCASPAATDLQASLTLSDGTVLPLTRQHFRTSSYATTSFSLAGLFVVAVPQNVTTGTLNVSITGTQFVRCGVSTFPLYGIDGITPAFVASNDVARGTGGSNTNTMSVNIGTEVAGVAILGEMVGTSTASYIYSASTQTTRRVAPFAVATSNNLATVTTTGIASTGTATQMEATGGAGGIMIAAAWNPAT